LQRLRTLLEEERETLPLWLPVALGAGIALWVLLPWASQRLALAAALAGLGLALLVLRQRWAGALLLVMLAGLATMEWRVARLAHVVLPQRTVASLTARIEAVEPLPARDQLRLVLAVERWEVPDPRLPDRVRVSLRGPAATQPGLGPGARIALRAALSPPAGPAAPGGHDMARALWFQQIGATGIVFGTPRLLTPAPPPSGPGQWLASTRLTLSARLRAALPGETGAIAAVFVTGDRGAVPPETASAIRDSGLAHLLSISGLHIAVVVGGTILIARRLLALWPWLALRVPIRLLALALGAGTGLTYTLLAGAQVPTVRAMLATLIVLAGLIAGREAFSLRLLAAAAFLILLVRPEVLLGPSFQMSFAAVAAIVALYESKAGRRWLAPMEDAPPLARLARGLAALLATGLVAELVLSPIGLYHFQQSGLYGVFANLFAIPLASFGIIPALVLGLAGDIFGLGSLAYQPAGSFIDWLLHIATITATLPGAVARLPAMHGLAYAVLIIGGLLLILCRSRLRLLGLPFVVMGLVLALGRPPPDLLISRDGRHVALRLPSGDIAMLRPRAGAFLHASWSAALAGRSTGLSLDSLPGMACSADACLGDLAGARGGRVRLLATRSANWLPQAELEPACRSADIVVSERRLPGWCQPRWLKLDAQGLSERGAIAIWLDRGRVTGSLDSAGDQPWRNIPAQDT
jgi:competence protein ComEC